MATKKRDPGTNGDKLDAIAPLITQREYIRIRNQQEAISKENPDPTPVHIPGITDQVPPLTLREEMQRYTREQISAAAAEAGVETIEEANDFEMDEADHDMLSVHSTVFITAPEPSLGPESLDGTPDEAQPHPSVETASEGSEEPSPDPAPSPESAPPGPENQ